MSRRSHTNRLARALSAAQPCTYSQALAQVLAARDTHQLPEILDEEGMAAALSYLLHDPNTTALKSTPPGTSDVLAEHERSTHLTLGDLVALGSLSQEMSDFLAATVRARSSILISGNVGSGKTTLLNALLDCVDLRNRVLIVEERRELEVATPNTLAFSAENNTEATMADILTDVLRIDTEYLVLGEVRDRATAAAYTKVTNSRLGNVLATIHANAPISAVAERMALLLERDHTDVSRFDAIETVANATDVMVHLRHGSTERYVSDIALISTSRSLIERARPADLGSLFTGHINEYERTIVFKRVGGVPQRSSFARRLYDADHHSYRWLSGLPKGPGITSPPEATDIDVRFVVEIRDELGYTKDAFDLVELPEGLRAMIIAHPDWASWLYTNEEGSTYEAERA